MQNDLAGAAGNSRSVSVRDRGIRIITAASDISQKNEKTVDTDKKL